MQRRNSLAYNISQFVNFEGSDFSILIDEIKKENANKSKDKEKMKAKGNRFTKIAEDILSGNMREIKSQVAVSFQFINRKYKDFHENAILHFVCQVSNFNFSLIIVIVQILIIS